MATTFQTYNGDGSNTTFTFTVPYIDSSDVKARVNDVATTAFSINGTTVTFSTAPPSGSNNVKIFRDTNNSSIEANFQSGSALRAVDFNDNFTQLLYVTQESTDVSDTATADAATAVTTANSAVATANTASTNATNAVNTANTASSNATTAVNTANTASTNATNAVNTANTANTTANTANTTANTASTNASAAVTTANTASTNASAAVSTANTASTNASNAVTTANAASATATAAQNAVANAVLYSPVANVAAIPGSPSNNDYIEVQDSTGIQSFSPLSGLPSGFTGASGLTVRLKYTTTGSTWQWQNYFANDPEDRYFTKSAGDTNTTNIASNTSSISTNTTNIATKMPLAGGTFTGAVNFDDNVVIKGDSTNGSGKLTLNCENNSHGVNIKGPPHSAGATYTLTLPDDTGTNGQALTTNGSGVLSWASTGFTGGTLTSALLVDNAASASAPDISFDGDPNTGIYSPGADQVSVSTGGTERLRVSSSGNVGIGTTSPQRPLHIDGTEGVVRLTSTASGNNGFEVGIGTSSQAFLWQAENASMEFGTNNAERMRIASSGNVGIGTSSPSVLLHIAATEPQFYIQDSNSTGNSVNATLQFRDSSNTQLSYFGYASGSDSHLSLFNTMSGGGLRFGTNSAERMSIGSNGLVTVKNGAAAEIATLTSGTTINTDFAYSSNFTVTLGHNATIANPSNLTAGQSGSIFLVQDGTGSRTAAWSSYWDFAGGTAPTLTTAANGVDRIDYIVRSSTSIHAVATLNYS